MEKLYSRGQRRKNEHFKERMAQLNYMLLVLLALILVFIFAASRPSFGRESKISDEYAALHKRSFKRGHGGSSSRRQIRDSGDNP